MPGRFVRGGCFLRKQFVAVCIHNLNQVSFGFQKSGGLLGFFSALLRLRRLRLGTRRGPLWRQCVPRRDKGGPGLAGFGVILGRSAGNRRNADQVLAVGALNLAARCLLVTLQVLLTVRTGEFELVHRFQCWLCFVATDPEQAPTFPPR